MQRRLVTGLAGGFALMTAILVVGAVVYSPALLVLAIVFGSVTYVLYAHATGRLLSRIYRRVERRAAAGANAGRGGFGAGPRQEWRPPREDQRRRARRQRVRQGRQRTGRRARRGQRRNGLTPREAREILGVEHGADDRTVKRAYRERIKDVHPDTAGGDEDEFKRVRAAYELLSE